jgi:hypothetical protein
MKGGSRVLVAHSCNLSYSGSRNQEDCGLRPVQAEFIRPYLQKAHYKKRAGRVAQGVGPEFKFQSTKSGGG